MRDIDLYRHLLGLEAPWTVTRVELSVGEGRVDVWADHGPRPPDALSELRPGAPDP
jgi:hypothetical protein